MIRLYVTRHGKTVMNQNRQYQGTSDSPLIEEGLIVTHELAKRLKEIEFAGAYCSPTGRTRQTAEILLADHPIEPVICDDLIELHFGEFEGQNIDASRQHHQDIFEVFYKAPERFESVKGLESPKDFQKKVEACLYRILDRHAHGNILIICHGIVVRSIIMTALNRPLKDFWIDGHIPGASLTEITYDQGIFDVITISDTSHMSFVPTD